LWFGVLGFGLGAWVLSLVYRYLIDEERWSMPTVALSLILSLIGGMAWGALMWLRFRPGFEARNARLAAERANLEANGSR